MAVTEVEKGCQIISIKATKRHYRNWGLVNAEFYSHLEDFGVFLIYCSNFQGTFIKPILSKLFTIASN